MKRTKRSFIYLFILTAALFVYSCNDQGTNNNLVVHAYFETESQSIAAGETIQFKGLSIGYPTTRKWTFEGGTPATSTKQNPTVTYKTSGEFDVTLTVSTGADSSRTIKEGYVLVLSGDYLSDHVVASFPFDGSAEDVGPHHVDVSNHGNVTFGGTDRDSVANSVAVFDGASALIVPDHPAFNFGTDDFSVSVWVKTDQDHKMMIWQESGAGGSGDNQAWLRIGDNTTDRLIRFCTEDSGGGNILNYGDGPESGIGDGQWHHVVTVREGGTTRVYIDGVKKGELEKSSIKNVSNGQDFKIGAQEGPVGSYKAYFSGSLDDLIIYDKALTDQEIANLYNL